MVKYAREKFRGRQGNRVGSARGRSDSGVADEMWSTRTARRGAGGSEGGSWEAEAAEGGRRGGGSSRGHLAGAAWDDDPATGYRGTPVQHLRSGFVDRTVASDPVCDGWVHVYLSINLFFLIFIFLIEARRFFFLGFFRRGKSILDYIERNIKS